MSLEAVVAALAGAGERHELRATDAAAGGWIELAVVRREDGMAVGSLALHELDVGTIEAGHLWVAPGFRGYGAGSEAAWLLAGACASAGIERLRAWAHPDLGLSVYFWIRMGLHPLFGEGPNGGIAFERDFPQRP